MIRHIIFVLALAGLITGCSSAMKPEDFANQEPRFVLEEFFEGKTKAWGIFEDRFGKLRRSFVVDITGTLEGDTLTLNEDFVYNDGETETRVWTITKIDDNTYRGTAGDIIGEATGRSFGNALNWQYDMNLKVGDGTWKVHFNDWMFLQPDGVMLNRATVTKWGFELGQVTLAFSKDPGAMVMPDQAAELTETLRAAE